MEMRRTSTSTCTCIIYMYMSLFGCCPFSMFLLFLCVLCTRIESSLSRVVLFVLCTFCVLCAVSSVPMRLPRFREPPGVHALPRPRPALPAAAQVQEWTGTHKQGFRRVHQGRVIALLETVCVQCWSLGTS